MSQILDICRDYGDAAVRDLDVYPLADTEAGFVEPVASKADVRDERRLRPVPHMGFIAAGADFELSELGGVEQGIAAVEGKRYDSLAGLFLTEVHPSAHMQQQLYVEAVAEGILALARDNVFKKLPGYGRNYTPMSEHLFKTLQPALDETLFTGRSYEPSFDRFEILLALVVMDLRNQKSLGSWAPIGRFGWKHGSGYDSPLQRFIDEAKSAGERWEPLRAGLFGGKVARFNQTAENLVAVVSKIGWW